MKKSYLIFLIIVLLFTGCASSRPWTKSEKVAAGYFILGHSADALSTEKMLENPNIYETNLILGKHPSDTKIAIYFSLTGIAALTISHFYPKLRLLFLSIYGTQGFGYALHNKRLMDNSSF